MPEQYLSPRLRLTDTQLVHVPSRRICQQSTADHSVNSRVHHTQDGTDNQEGARGSRPVPCQSSTIIGTRQPTLPPSCIICLSYLKAKSCSFQSEGFGSSLFSSSVLSIIFPPGPLSQTTQPLNGAAGPTRPDRCGQSDDKAQKLSSNPLHSH